MAENACMLAGSSLVPWRPKFVDVTPSLTLYEGTARPVQFLSIAPTPRARKQAASSVQSMLVCKASASTLGL